MSQALDPTVVRSLQELGGSDQPELFGELVETFASDSPPRLQAIQDALAKGDGPALQRAAHGLKSSAANMGALRLAEFCRMLEQAGHAGRLEDAARIATSLQAEFDDALAALDAARA